MTTKTQTTTLAVTLALLALAAFAAPVQAFDAQMQFKADSEQNLLLTDSPGGGGVGSCSLLNLVCATARANAYAYDCYDPVAHLVFPCWYAYGGGSVYGELGSVAGALTGYANGVPMTNNCYAPGLGTPDGCVMNTYADRYPGATIQVTITVTATAPYGAADDTAIDFDSNV